MLLTTYNSEKVIAKTLQSIESQDYPDIQLCIADSCSKDKTLEIIEEYKSRSKYEVICESQKDTGIYDGLNNALALATGDYIQVMNDELTCSDAISKLVAAIEKEETSCVCMNSSHSIGADGGNALNQVLGAHSDLVYAEDGKVVRYWKMGRGNIHSGWMPAHPTLMLKREVYEKYGNYNTSYICSADYEFMVRILKNGGTLGYVPEVLVSMYYGGTSNSSLGSYWLSIREAMKALWTNRVFPILIITGLRTIRVALQFAKSGKANSNYLF